MKLLKNSVNMVMKNVVVFLVLFFLAGGVNAEIYYEVGLDYDDGSLSVGSVDVFYDRFGYSNPPGDVYNISYLFDLLDYEGNVLFSENVGVINFDFNETLDSDNPENDEMEIVYKNKFRFNVFLPYSEDVNLIVVKSIGGDVAESIDVRTYAKERGEFDISDDGQFVKKDDEVESNKSIPKKEEGVRDILFYFLLLIIFVVLIYFGFYYLLGKKRKGTKGFIKK